MKRYLLPIGMISIAALALCAAAVLAVMTLVLHSDVKALEGQFRNAARMEETLRADIEVIRRDLDAATKAAATQAASPQVEATQAASAPPDVQEPRVISSPAASPVAATTAPARFIKVKAGASSECAFHPGDPQGLMDCIRRQESRTPNYR